MGQISISNGQTTGLNGQLAAVQTLDIDDKPLGEGGFGAVYRCRAVDGLPLAIPQVVKLFRDNGYGSAAKGINTIQRLQARLSDENAKQQTNGSDLITAYPALLGAPQFSFEGLYQGRSVSGYCANNLKELGFEEFKDILDDQPAGLLLSYQRLPADRKLLLAYQLASAFRLLREKLYIHADFKAGALFVNLTTTQCAIIDYDSGAVLDNEHDRPSTFGEMQDWLAPEIMRQLADPANQGRRIQVDFYSDMWSVAVGIYYLLTTVHPLFFLTEISSRSVQAYSANSQWPDASSATPYFNVAQAGVYAQVKSYYDTQIPPPIKDKLEAAINKGFSRPTMRPSYAQWQTVLGAIQVPPKVDYFAVTPQFTVKGQPVTLTWAVQSAAEVLIGQSVYPAAGSLKLMADQTGVYQLTATNAFGTTTEMTLPVQVVEVPEIKLLIPSPAFSISVSPSPLFTRLPTLNLAVPFDFDRLIGLQEESMPALPATQVVRRTLTSRLRELARNTLKQF